MSEKFDQWGLLEIMGHQRYAGRISEQAVGGASFVRVDVPAMDGLQGFSKLFGAGSIFCITPMAEDVARMYAKQLKQQPLSVYDLPEEIRAKLRERPALTAGGSKPVVEVSTYEPHDDDYDDDDDDDYDDI